jgi:drug/metabolite transporter (DMT)-like permease
MPDPIESPSTGPSPVYPPTARLTVPAPSRAPIDNRRGALWMIGGSVCFVATNSLVKHLGTDFPPPEIAFFRCLSGLLLIVPFVARQGLSVFRTTRADLHTVRFVCAVIALNLGFYATAHLPLATVTALNFTRPLFMIVLAVLILRERVHWRRGVATVVGFAGVIIMLGPTNLGLTPPALAALSFAALTAGSMVVIRRQAGTDGTGTIMVWFAAGSAALSIIPAVLVWHTPDTLHQWLMLVLVGFIASVGQYFLIQAFIHGEATVMNPIDYSQIILAALLGYAVFGERTSVWTWTGAAIIVSSTLYILLREQALGKKPG